MIEIKKKVHFFDCDPADIMFYARIFFFCHAAYEELIKSMQLDFEYWLNDEFVVPILNSSARYLKPLRPGDELTIRVTVSQLRNSSFELSYKCINQSDELCAVAKTAHIFLNKEKWEKIKIPSVIRSGLEKHLEPIIP